MNRKIIYMHVFIILLICGSSFAEKQIMVDVRIAEITEDAALNFGVIYDYEAKKGSLGDTTLYLPGLVTVNSAGKNVAWSGGRVTFNALDVRYGGLRATIEAAVNEGKVKLRANPIIIVKSGQAGHIHIGEEEPYVTKTVATYPTLVTAFIETGVSLTVTPTIIREGVVHMVIHPEVSVVTGYKMDAQNYELPIISKKEIDTVVVVESGRTVCIGGLVSEDEKEVTIQLPYLGRIPLLGWAFKSKVKSKIRTEMIMHITPNIVSPEDQIVFPGVQIIEDGSKQSKGILNRLPLMK